MGKSGTTSPMDADGSRVIQNGNESDRGALMQYFSDDWFRAEWRKLGFYYELNHEARRWEITGSLSGLTAFSSAVRSYAMDSEHDWVSCHCNLGPYDYLEIGTWEVAVIDDHWIAGRLEDLLELAGYLDGWLATGQPGTSLSARSFHAPSAPYDLCLYLKEPGFDPASLDESLS